VVLLDQIAHLLTEDGDCLLWRGACCNGHPSKTMGGKTLLLRRALYAELHGTIPPGRILQPTCGQRRCLNLEHARLTTHKAVALECGALGLMGGTVRSARIAAAKRAGPQARITQDVARSIFRSDESGAALARRHGITPSHVSKIRLGKARRDFSSPWIALGG
jgi:hypothetical protein